MKLFARIQNLVTGLLSQWMNRREHRNPGAVYEAAIQGRTEQYAKLRAAAAGVLYVRTKLGKELEAKTTELTRLRAQLDIAVDRDDDEAALALIQRRDACTAEVRRLSDELKDLSAEAETAKKNLLTFQHEIARLRDEKVRMVARLANAKARLRLHETLGGVSVEADIRALEGIRDHINKLVTEAQMSKDGFDSDLEQRLGTIRDAEATAAARAQLDEMKRRRPRPLLPVFMPVAAS